MTQIWLIKMMLTRSRNTHTTHCGRRSADHRWETFRVIRDFGPIDLSSKLKMATRTLDLVILGDVHEKLAGTTV